MKKTNRLLFLGLAISIIVSLTIGLIALDHNPQNEYDDLKQLLSLCYIYAATVMFPFTIVVIIIEIINGAKNKP